MALGKVDYTADNLLVSTKKLITADELLLESGSVVRGEVLKKGTTGLVALAATTDIPYCVALQAVDATGGAEPITYTFDGGVKDSELTYGAGDISNFRDKFVTETRLFVEE